MRVTKNAVLNVVACAFVIFNCGITRADDTSGVLVRQPGVQELQKTFSVDQYESVPYEVNYTESIPYQAEETYTDYETQYVSERVCHTTYTQACANETVCHPVSNSVCNSVPVCTSSPSQESCTTVPECGTNALGEAICKDRQVCTSSGGGQSCHNEQQCSTNSENVCSSEYRCNQVPQESCGYEQVARQVPVTKTRIVTRYNTVSKCCRTEYRNEYVSTDTLTAVVRFPKAATLNAGEKETISIYGSVSSNSVSIDDSQAIYGYKIASQKKSGGKLIVELALRPKFSAEQAGKSSISSLYLKMQQGGKSAVTLVDSLVLPRITNTYAATVKDKATGKVLATGTGASAGSKQVSVALNAALPVDRDLVIDLKVSRKSILLAAAVSFSVQADWDFRFEDPAQFSDANLVAVTEISGQKADTKIIIRDASAEHPLVQTQYDILVERNGGFLGLGKKDLAQGIVSRDQLKKNAAGDLEIGLVNDLKADVAAVEKHADAKSSLKITVKVIRQSPRINNGQIIEIKKTAKLKVK